MSIRHIVICGLTHSTIFFHIISKTTRFLKEVIDYGTWVLIFYKASVRNISNSKKLWMTYNHQYVHWSSRKVPAILVRLYWIFNFLNRFSKNIQISYFLKIRLFGVDFIHADRQMGGRMDGQTDRYDESNNRFCQLCKYILLHKLISCYNKL